MTCGTGIVYPVYQYPLARQGRGGDFDLCLSISRSPSLRDTWEKKPILIRRQNPDYYRGLFSTAEFDRILRDVGTFIDATMTSISSISPSHPPCPRVCLVVIDIIKNRCCIDCYCLLVLTSRGAAILDRSTAPLSVICLAGAINCQRI